MTQVYPGPGSGGGTQVYPGSGDGGGTQVYPGGGGITGGGIDFPVTPTQGGTHGTFGPAPVVTQSGGSTNSLHHHSGHYATHKTHHHTPKQWHAPAHPSRRKDLPPGVEDQTF